LFSVADVEGVTEAVLLVDFLADAEWLVLAAGLLVLVFFVVWALAMAAVSKNTAIAIVYFFILIVLLKKLIVLICRIHFCLSKIRGCLTVH
jgi:hypothetical protein